MNTATATIKFVRTSPRKLRLVADAIRGLDSQSALAQLQFVPKRATRPLIKALKQAEANANQKNLLPPYRIHALLIDKGPIYKRWQSVSRGRAHSLHKPTSHVKITLIGQTIETPAAKAKPAQKSPTQIKKSPTKKSAAASKKSAPPKTSTRRTKKSPTAAPKPKSRRTPRVTAPRTTSK
jgi:large subunit ribosomal protein L22